MIDIEKAKVALKDFLKNYNSDEDKSGFNLKVVHTYHVAEAAKEIAKKLDLSEEDIKLAELIGLLHDIGRFDEIRFTGSFDSKNFNHGMHGSKLLFEDGLIRDFILDSSYDNIIKKAIENHNKMSIEEGLSERELLHSKIIRDADQLDNYRVKKEEKIENIFPGRIKSDEEIENSPLSDKVYETVLSKRLVDIRDRVYPLDWWVCILAFTFDMNFKVTFKMMQEKDYINVSIDKFDYKNQDSKEKMEIIRNLINNFIEEKINE